MQQFATIWVEMGVGAKRHFFNVSILYDTLAENSVKSLSGFHGPTGNDFIPAHHGKGKVRP